MILSSYDRKEYKARQCKNWDELAPKWSKDWDTIRQRTQPVSDRLITLAQIRKGHRVLDVATGTGEPATTALRAVGSEGYVLGIDLSSKMIEIAKNEAFKTGLENIEFQVMDGEALEVDSNSFDAVLCRWGLMFMPDLEATLQRMRSALVPGGRLALSTWGPPEKAPMVSLLEKVTVQLFGPMPEKGPGPCSLSDEVKLIHLLAKVGFVDVISERMIVVGEWSSPEEFTKFRQDISLMDELLRNKKQEERFEFWERVTEEARKYVTPDGVVRMTNEAICFVGQKPG